MLKLKILFSALLLTASINAFAVCIHNHTAKSIYFRSDILTQDIEITPNNEYCAKEDSTSFNFAVFVIDTVDMRIVCASIHLGVKNNIVVVPSGEHPSCIIS